MKRSRPRKSVWERIVSVRGRPMTLGVAEEILQLRFTEKDKARYIDLAERHGDGTLTPDEKAELEEFVTAGQFLEIFHSMAKARLRRKSPAA